MVYLGMGKHWMKIEIRIDFYSKMYLNAILRGNPTFWERIKGSFHRFY